MSLTLTVDGDRWRTHLRAVADAHAGLVPVIKGNGYGFGNHRLARRAAWLGVDTVAVGTYEELPEVASRFDGDLLVLTPWRPFGTALELAPALGRRVVHTVGRTEDLVGLLDRDPDARFVLERLTSMRRHGFTATGLREAADLLRSRGFSDGDQRLRGVALHLPLARGEHLPEVHRLLDDVVAAGLGTPTAWVSHLTDAELASLATSHADFGFRPRTGTALWLGDRGALRVGATVLDVHPLERGDVYGYRARHATRAGHLLVVSGGTAHGIGLESPTGEGSMRSRAGTVARGGLDAIGVVRSPFTVDGKPRLFAEPPHMQASMLLLPEGTEVPAVGDEVEVRVRFTATQFDRIVVS